MTAKPKSFCLEFDQNSIDKSCADYIRTLVFDVFENGQIPLFNDGVVHLHRGQFEEVVGLIKGQFPHVGISVAREPSDSIRPEKIMIAADHDGRNRRFLSLFINKDFGYLNVVMNFGEHVHGSIPNSIKDILTYIVGRESNSEETQLMPGGDQRDIIQKISDGISDAELGNIEVSYVDGVLIISDNVQYSPPRVDRGYLPIAV